MPSINPLYSEILTTQLNRLKRVERGVNKNPNYTIEEYKKNSQRVKKLIEEVKKPLIDFYKNLN